MSTHRENPMTATSTQAGRPQSASTQLPEVPLTTEGYSVLHQMMRFRWTAWRGLPDAARKDIAQEAAALLGAMEKNSEGQSALFSLIGHKGDLMLVHFRKSFADLNQAELKLAGLRLNEYGEPTSSYLSIIELGLYDSTLKSIRSLPIRVFSRTPINGRPRSNANLDATARRCIRVFFLRFRRTVTFAFIP